MSSFHNFELQETEVRYFRYFFGAVSGISETDFLEKRGSSLGMTASGVGPFASQRSVIGDAHAGSGADDGNAMYAIFYGSRLKQIGGAATFSFQNAVGHRVEGYARLPGAQGGDTGGSFGGGDQSVGQPEAPSSTPTRPLPTGNGNGGFGSVGGGGTAQGISGGNV